MSNKPLDLSKFQALLTVKTQGKLMINKYYGVSKPKRIRLSDVYIKISQSIDPKVMMNPKMADRDWLKFRVDYLTIKIHDKTRRYTTGDHIRQRIQLQT
jgi:hypothetical protein